MSWSWRARNSPAFLRSLLNRPHGALNGQTPFERLSPRDRKLPPGGLVLPPASAQSHRFQMPWGPPHDILPLSDRDDALVVIEEVEVRPGLTPEAWFSMIKVRT